MVSLPKPQVVAVGGVGVLGGRQMGLFLGGVEAVAPSVQDAPDSFGQSPAPGGVREEALPGDGSGHQLEGRHLQGEHQHVPPLPGQGIRHLHAKGGLTQGADGAQHIEPIVKTAVQSLIQGGKARRKGRALGLTDNVGVQRIHLSGCAEGFVRRGHVRQAGIRLGPQE